MDEFDRMTVLLVDPHLSARAQLRVLLEELGVRAVLDVPGPAEAIAAIRTHSPDVAFVDWSAATDAPALLRRLREPGSPNPFLPVVVVTAYGDREHVREVRDAGATEYLLKPFAPQSVAARLRAVVKYPRRFVECRDFFGPDRRRHSCRDWPEDKRRH